MRSVLAECCEPTRIRSDPSARSATRRRMKARSRISLSSESRCTSSRRSWRSTAMTAPASLTRPRTRLRRAESMLISPVNCRGPCMTTGCSRSPTGSTTSMVPSSTTKKRVFCSPTSNSTSPAAISRRLPIAATRAICASVSSGNICAERASIGLGLGWDWPSRRRIAEPIGPRPWAAPDAVRRRAPIVRGARARLIWIPRDDVRSLLAPDDSGYPSGWPGRAPSRLNVRTETTPADGRGSLGGSRSSALPGDDDEPEQTRERQRGRGPRSGSRCNPTPRRRTTSTARGSGRSVCLGLTGCSGAGCCSTGWAAPSSCCSASTSRASAGCLPSSRASSSACTRRAACWPGRSAAPRPIASAGGPPCSSGRRARGR